MSVRKNFIFDDEIASHLEQIATRKQKSQTQIIKELIEKEYQEVSKEKKLEAFYKFAGSGTGLFGDLTIQEIKANRDV
ncbi:MAG: hypothetical protein U9N49_05250 [Campylobacterota bacterium]|nr:hypothetical protein [Campylobacterota bacterium]